MKIVSPPKHGCYCRECNRRRVELELAERLERELYQGWSERRVCSRALAEITRREAAE